MSLRLDRLLAIVIKLLANKRLTTRALADSFSVSTRTIYRDLQTISLAGIPVIPFQGHQGGWELDPDYVLDRRLLSHENIATMLSALQNAKQGMDHPNITEAIEKLNSLVNPQKRADLDKKLNHIVIDYQPWCFRKSGLEDVNLIHHSITETRLIEFRYLNRKTERTLRRVEPMTLLLKGSTWYLFGYCVTKNDYRLFRVSRMTHLTTLPHQFTRREMTIDTFQKPMIPEEKRVMLHIRFHKSIIVAMSDYLGYEICEDVGDYLTHKINVPESDWLYSFLLGFGDKLDVLSPKRIATHIEKMAQEILSRTKKQQK